MTRYITRLTPEQGEALYKLLQQYIAERNMRESQLVSDMHVSSNLFSVLRERRYALYPGIRTMERIAHYFNLDYVTFIQHLAPVIVTQQPGFDEPTGDSLLTDSSEVDLLKAILAELRSIRSLFEKIWL